jgi:hypothetical protein
VAKTLNERGIKTAAGKSWAAVQVTRVRERLGQCFVGAGDATGGSVGA